MSSSLPARLATWFVAFVVGIVYGLAGTIAHAYAWGWFPLGLILAIAGSGALLAAVRLLTGDRWTALAAGLGMIVATVVFSGRGPGGSVIVPGVPDGQFNPGIVWTLAVPFLVAIVVAWPDRLGPVEPDADAEKSDVAAADAVPSAVPAPDDVPVDAAPSGEQPGRGN